MSSKYEKINNILFDIKETLSINNNLSNEVERKILLLEKEIQKIRENEHQEKQNIINLISKL